MADNLVHALIASLAQTTIDGCTPSSDDYHKAIAQLQNLPNMVLREYRQKAPLFSTWSSRLIITSNDAYVIFRPAKVHAAFLTVIKEMLVAQHPITHDVLFLRHVECYFGTSRMFEPDLTVRPIKPQPLGVFNPPLCRPHLVVEVVYFTKDIDALCTRVGEYFDHDNSDRDTTVAIAIFLSPDCRHAQAVKFTRHLNSFMCTPVFDFGPEPATEEQMERWLGVSIPQRPPYCERVGEQYILHLEIPRLCPDTHFYRFTYYDLNLRDIVVETQHLLQQ